MAARATTPTRISPEEQLRSVPLFAGLDDGALKELATQCRRRALTAGASLFREGDSVRTLYIVLSGSVLLRRAANDAKGVYHARRGPGDYFGERALFDDLPCTADAETDSSCDLLLLDRGDLMRFLEAHPSAAWGIIRTLSARLREISGEAVRSATLDVLGRLAAFLYDTCATVKPDGTNAYTLPRMTNEQIAQRIDTSRESVNRSLARLAAMGAIARQGRIVIVTDLTKLRSLCSVALP